MARAEKRWRRELGLPERPDRAGAVDDAAAVIRRDRWSPSRCSALVTFVQVLYLESLRLRTRDLPSLKFFKETLEDQIGLEDRGGRRNVLADQALAAGLLLGDPLLRLVRRRPAVDGPASSGRRAWPSG